MRVEDTDRERFVPDAAEKLIKILQNFGLDPDEGPHKPNAKYAPYVQSQRLEIYKKYSQELVLKKQAYYCFCAPERLENLRKAQEAQKIPPRYDGHCRGLEEEAVNENFKAGVPFVIRHKMPKTGITEFDDLVYGRLQFKNDLLDDSILIKSDGYPVYNFANVVDDHLMEITHVIRGEEFLSSTPKHVLLYKAFGWTPPVFFHLPLILDEKRQKLSKRSGDVAVEEYLKKGYLKESILNFIALLGWNPKTNNEIFSKDELVSEFSVEKVNKAGAVFDVKKMDFLDREWRKKLKIEIQDDPLFSRAETLTKDALGSPFSADLLKKIWPQILERISGPSDLETRIREFYFYFSMPDYDSQLLHWKQAGFAETKNNLQLLKNFLSGLDLAAETKESLEKRTKALLTESAVPFGNALWPLRIALSGQKNSPSPFEIITAFAADKKSEIFERLEKAINKIS